MSEDLVIPTKLGTKIEDLLEHADAIDVIDLGTKREAIDTIADMKSAEDTLEKLRVELTKPSNDLVTKINSAFRARRTPLETARKALKEKVLDHGRREAEAARIENERLAAEAAKRQKAALEAAKSDPDGVVQQIAVPQVATPLATTRSYGGSATVRKIKKHRVVDFAALPDDYKLANDKMLAGMARAGAPCPPGVEFYEEEDLAVRRSG